MKLNYIKKLISLSILLIITIISFFIFSGLTQVQSTTNGQVSYVFYFGLRDDASPVSYLNKFQDWRGYCVHLQNSLQAYINNPKRHPYNIEFISRQVSLKNRYKGKSNDGTLLDIECGPNTISEKSKKTIEQYQGIFSEPFAWTGAKVLLKKENKKLFYNLEPFKEEKVGVYGKTIDILTTDLEAGEHNTSLFKEGETTTSNFINKIFTSAKIENVERGKAFEKLKNNEIKGYISDEIILLGILKEEEQENKDTNISKKYSIVPHFSKLSYETYGIVVYSQENHKDISQQILNDINNFIKTPEAKKIIQKYELDDFPKKWLNGIEELYYYDFNLWIAINCVAIFSIAVFILLLILIIKTRVKTMNTQQKPDTRNESNSPKTKVISDFLRKIGFPRKIAQIIINLIQLESYNNDNREASIGNFANKNKDNVSQQANQDNTDISSTERDDTLS